MKASKRAMDKKARADEMMGKSSMMHEENEFGDDDV